MQNYIKGAGQRSSGRHKDSRANHTSVKNSPAFGLTTKNWPKLGILQCAVRLAAARFLDTSSATAPAP